jgi:hypothetical protein
VQARTVVEIGLKRPLSMGTPAKAVVAATAKTLKESALPAFRSVEWPPRDDLEAMPWPLSCLDT